MCGIAGIYNYSASDKPVPENILKKMLSVIRYRGPDESGIYIGKNIGMGNVRLSIIDLSTGQQPISVRDKKYWIVYNGELFNYLELKQDLEKLGCKFSTTTDTEVVVQAYAQYGIDCLSKFNGQFAIAIWDKKKKELFLARDRVGIRPLFYTQNNGSFTFCSEIKGIFENPEVKRSISPKGLSQIFTFWTTITPETPFENIYELPPGHYMTINSRETKIEKYWSLSFPEKHQVSDRSFYEATEELRDLFNDAVKIRLRADVEVAAYLSGGLDSSVTTAFIKDIEPNVLNTFSIGFKDKVFDETGYQLEASKYFSTNHVAFSCTSEEIGSAFYDTVKHTEFPILRTAPTPMYLLSKKVRENNIKVVITGEGADEMLAGYNIFKEAKIRRFWSKEPQSAIRPLLLTKLYPYLPMMKDAKSNVLKMFFGYKLDETGNPYYSHLLRWHNTSRIKNYFSDDIKSKLGEYDPILEVHKNLDSQFADWGDLGKSQFLEASIFMSGYLLSSQGDRMAMANSVEGRYPFLDHRIIEFAASLPEDFKLNGLNEKYILKQMMKGKIPESILTRHKQAYRAPIHTSFFGDKSPSYVEEMLSENSINDFGFFDTVKVNKLTEKFKTGRNISEVDNMALAGILSTQLINLFFIKEKTFDSSEGNLTNMKVVEEH
ncbi:MAG: asparagine synthase (glutamine-hydrolyzing) [Bacteroidales bacterium]|nr:asparagine synthase (glutamine-hydrolyzing) [Bacteroidales bacterium]